MTEDELIARVKAHRDRERAALLARVQVWECDGGDDTWSGNDETAPGTST